MFPTFGSPVSPSALVDRTSDLFDLDFRSVEIDPDSGAIALPSGHSGTWSRNATLSGVLDVNGTTYSALGGQMAWEMRDVDGDGVRESFGLVMGTSDFLSFPASVRVMAMSGLLEMVETGAVATSGATLFALRNNAASGAGLWLDSSGSAYRLNFSDGSTTRTATLASGPTTGDFLTFLWDLTSTGVLSLSLSINGRTAISADAAALTLPSSWETGVSWRINSRGSSANPAQGWYRRARVMAGYVPFEVRSERR